MVRNGNGYVQKFKGPGGEQMVVLRAEDFAALLKAAAGRTPHDAQEDIAPDSEAAIADVRRLIDKLFQKMEHKEEPFASCDFFFSSELSGMPVASDANDESDEAAFARAKAALAHRDDELVPESVARRLLLSDEAPLRIWREYRGLTQKQLAKLAARDQSTISNIERRKATGDVDTLKALAGALGVQIDDLVI